MGWLWVGVACLDHLSIYLEKWSAQSLAGGMDKVLNNQAYP